MAVVESGGASFLDALHGRVDSILDACTRLAAILEIAGRHAEAQSALVQFYQQHPEFSASDGMALRLVSRLSKHPQMVEALNKLGVRPTKTSGD